MEFIYSDELKKRYQVMGSFYNIEMNGANFSCRNALKINEKGYQLEKVDAIFVLMNPGSSEPKQKNIRIHTYQQNDEVPIYWLDAKPDPTQYQVMRIMNLKQWRSVQLINLSDIRAGNIPLFKENLALVKKKNFHHHTIFSEKRKPELQSVLNLNVPIILAWGIDRFLEPLANNALHYLPIERIKGWAHEKSPYYYHANPQLLEKKIGWLEKMNDIL